MFTRGILLARLHLLAVVTWAVCVAVFSFKNMSIGAFRTPLHHAFNQPLIPTYQPEPKIPTYQPQPTIDHITKCTLDLEDGRCIAYNVSIPSGVVDERYEHVQVGENRADTRIIYNRMPKCGSSTVVRVLHALTYRNNASFLHSMTFTKQDLTRETEAALVQNLETRRAPWIFDRHIRMLNFTKFGFPMPHYINVYREPAERHRSHYYFEHDLYIYKNMSFDECVARRIGNCSYTFNILRYFCGHEENCTVTDRQTLEIAKQNVVRYYDVVGLTEDMEGFFQLLEIHFPEVFTGAVEVYRMTEPVKTDTNRKSHEMQESTIDFLKKTLWAEYEFYEFVKHRFYDAKLKAGIK